MSITRLVFKKAEPSAHEQLSLFNNEGPATPAPAPTPTPAPVAPAPVDSVRSRGRRPIVVGPPAPRTDPEVPLPPSDSSSPMTIVPDVAHLRALHSAMLEGYDNHIAPFPEGSTIFDWHHAGIRNGDTSGPGFYTAHYEDPDIQKILAQHPADREFTLLPVSQGMDAYRSHSMNRVMPQAERTVQEAVNQAVRPLNPAFVEAVRNDAQLKGEDGFHLYRTTAANRPRSMNSVGGNGYEGFVDWLGDIHEKKSEALANKTIIEDGIEKVVPRDIGEKKTHKGFIFLCHEQLGDPRVSTNSAFCHRRAIASSLQDVLRSREAPGSYQGAKEAIETKWAAYLRHLVDTRDANLPYPSFDSWLDDQYGKYVKNLQQTRPGAAPLPLMEHGQPSWWTEHVPLDFSDTPNILVSPSAKMSTETRRNMQVVPPAVGWHLGTTRQELESSAFEMPRRVRIEPLVQGVQAALNSSSIFNHKADVLIHPASLDGSAESGQLTDEFKARYPQFYEAYKALCDTKSMQLGDIFWFQPRNKDAQPYGPAILTMFVRETSTAPIANQARQIGVMNAEKEISKRYPYDKSRGATVICPIIGGEENQQETTDALKKAFDFSSHHVLLTGKVIESGTDYSGTAPPIPADFIDPEIPSYPNDEQHLFFGDQKSGASTEAVARKLSNFSPIPFDTPAAPSTNRPSRIASSEYLYQLLKLSGVDWRPNASVIKKPGKSKIEAAPNGMVFETAGNITDENFHRRGTGGSTTAINGYDVIVNTCNTTLRADGTPVMGAGLAKSFSMHFAGTDYEKQVSEYIKRMKSGGVDGAVGTTFICQPMFEGKPIGPKVASMFVKGNFNDQATRRDTESSIDHLHSQLAEMTSGLTRNQTIKVAMPLVSAKLGERGRPVTGSVAKTGGWQQTRKKIIGTFGQNPQKIITDIVHLSEKDDGRAVPLLSPSDIQKYIVTDPDMGDNPFKMKAFVRNLPINDNWDQIKDSAMKFSLIAKVFGNRDFARVLMGQQGKELVEVSAPVDPETPFGRRSAVMSVKETLAHPDVTDTAFQQQLRTRKWIFESRKSDEDFGPQAFIRNLKAEGFTKNQIAAISLKIRQEIMEEWAVENPAWKGELDDDGSTVHFSPEAMQELYDDEPGLQRVMVGNHGMYLEMNDVRVSSPYPEKKPNNFYDTYKRGPIKYYRQKSRVNYAEYEPGKWYADIDHYPNPQEGDLYEPAGPVVDPSLPDLYWGTTRDSRGFFRGENMLGRLLMEIRDDIANGTIDITKPYPVPSDLKNMKIFGCALADIAAPRYQYSEITSIVSPNQSPGTVQFQPAVQPSNPVPVVPPGFRALASTTQVIQPETEALNIDATDVDNFTPLPDSIYEVAESSQEGFLRTLLSMAPKDEEIITQQNNDHSGKMKEFIDQAEAWGKTHGAIDQKVPLRMQFYLENLDKYKILAQDIFQTNAELICERSWQAMKAFEKNYPGWMRDAEDTLQDIFHRVISDTITNYNPEKGTIEQFLGFKFSRHQQVIGAIIRNSINQQLGRTKDWDKNMRVVSLENQFNQPSTMDPEIDPFIKPESDPKQEDPNNEDGDKLAQWANSVLAQENGDIEDGDIKDGGIDPSDIEDDNGELIDNLTSEERMAAPGDASPYVQRLIRRGANYVVDILHALGGNESKTFDEKKMKRIHDNYGLTAKEMQDWLMILEVLRTSAGQKTSLIEDESQQRGVDKKVLMEQLDRVFVKIKPIALEIIKNSQEQFHIDENLIKEFLPGQNFTSTLRMLQKNN